MVAVARRASVQMQNVQVVIQKLAETSRVLHPMTSDFCQKWDFLVGIALIFTAVVTPFEVAFLAVKLDGLFVANRLFDIIFAYDIAVNMRLAFFNKHDRVWVVDPHQVRR